MPKQPSLKSLRTKLGLTKIALARLAGISTMTIIRAEKAGNWPRNPSVRKALEIALGIAQ